MTTNPTWTPWGPSSPRHALRQRPQPELWDGEVGEAGAAAQGGSRAREDDRTVPALDHSPRGRLANVKSPEAADPPAALEVGRVDVEDVGLLERAGVEHYEIRIAQIAIDLVEDAQNIFGTRDVRDERPDIMAAIGLDQRIELGPVSGDCRDPASRRTQSAWREPSRDRAPLRKRQLSLAWAWFRSLRSLG